MKFLRNNLKSLSVSVGESGSGIRPRKTFELPGTNLSQPKTPDNNVIEKKLKEIMKQSGILHINGVVSEIHFFGWCRTESKATELFDWNLFSRSGLL